MNCKRTFIFKCICLILSFMMCMNVFAAAVSDNDGSAFISKAEFDSLKNTFQSRLDEYNRAIDNKIDNAISSYLSGIKQGETILLDNNLAILANNYNVYWSGQSTGLVTSRVQYGAEFQIQVGGRNAGYGSANTRCAQGVASFSGSFVKFPIITKETETTTSGTVTRYVINYWEERKPWLTYCGFFLFNGDYYSTWPSGANINGIFSTKDMNPNSNDIYARQDQWWNTVNGTGAGGSPWAMSIWAVYSTKSQNKDTKNIYIAPNAGSTYCWSESDVTKSTGSANSVVPGVTNNGNWNNTGGAGTYSGAISFIGYVPAASATFPWCHTQYTYKNLYDDRIRTITGVTKPISDGLLLTASTGPGTLKIPVKGTSSGTITFIVKDDEDNNTLKTVSDTATTTNKQISIDLRTLNKNKNFHVWVKYTPSSQSILTIGNIYYEKVPA